EGFFYVDVSRPDDFVSGRRMFECCITDLPLIFEGFYVDVSRPNDFVSERCMFEYCITNVPSIFRGLFLC
ncbi:MAG TPA: hypothetical protein PKY29_03615, partial [Ferruginibacter sp.]|nr:hypothetical protein [Ferruginibacter sp.]